MPTEIEPIDPERILPKKPEENVVNEDDMIQIPEAEEVPKVPPPDVSHIVKKINETLAKPWRENEFRCGRSYMIGNDFDPAELKEVIKIFSSSKWAFNVSRERRGVILSFKPPEEKKNEPSDRRGRGGYL